MQQSTIYDVFHDNASFPLFAIIGYFPPPPLITGPPPRRLWCKKQCLSDIRDPSKINESEINILSITQTKEDKLLTTSASLFDIKSTSKYVLSSNTLKLSITDLLLNRPILTLSVLLLIALVLLNIAICTYFLIHRSRRRQNTSADEINNNCSRNTNDVLLNNVSINQPRTLFVPVCSTDDHSHLKKMRNQHYSDATDADVYRSSLSNEQREEIL
ncbi:unnamed protein product [Didymodactylos carnosus]|uniref:Uncharacterized protein n=1 Tax=Didymodactylos carnosus TaxID=1234261 RepID=A0A814NP42_9BILA|nr:unnamed protein product [Didymodactylos carnosus]CAF1093079.1 unnamed protein product [Didymodactylos carnosus]CAF3696937.1 unnamed protein product [Didymodactylos carnosus]CAF3858469.1 unnamed protein product [Didymodactylos carnosus]